MVTSTELGYLSGVTSNIQDQLNGKALSSHDHYRISSYARDAELLHDSTLLDRSAFSVLLASTNYADTYDDGFVCHFGWDSHPGWWDAQMFICVPSSKCPQLQLRSSVNTPEFGAWRTLLSDVPHSTFYGSSFPDSPVSGQLYFLRA